MRIPRSTYRLQLDASFTLGAARRVLPYLHSLGISDVYLSPVLRARSGSAHGYDVVDPTKVDGARGGLPALRALSRAARMLDMGVVLDLVPNHMVASHENRWWVDVLRRGRDSAFARFFDIDWSDGRIVLPVLGEPLSNVLAARELEVVRDGARTWLAYHGRRFPIRGRIPRNEREFERAMERQHYRLVPWREGGNYRRFFDINDLVAVRVEDRAVFEATHRLVASLCRDGTITGLRIDHIDGLADPETYLRRLKRATKGVYTVVEKVLAPDERLPSTWATEGTTGYDFAARATDALIDPKGFERLRRIAAEFTGAEDRWAELTYNAKRQILDELFAGDVALLARAAEPLVPAAARAGLADAIESVTACMDVYRTYLKPDDRRAARRAVAEAKARAGSSVALRALGRLLGSSDRAALRWVTRWQQLSGAVMAKGVEDTAFYRSHVLVARNEVGGDPGAPVSDGKLPRARPRGSLNATSTHDTKRSEDVRARLAVLSEIPDEWEGALKRWRGSSEGIAWPNPGEELLFYQTAVGAWPLDERDVAGFPDRVEQAMIKSAREAKLDTSWLEPDAAHEEALARAVRDTFALEPLRADIEAFVERVAHDGAMKSLEMLQRKVRAPGVPDFYQGTELWSFRLVDPDNRGPVDFEERARILVELDERAERDPSGLRRELEERWRDGRLKLLIMAVALRGLVASDRGRSGHVDRSS